MTVIEDNNSSHLFQIQNVEYIENLPSFINHTFSLFPLIFPTNIFILLKAIL